MTIPIYRPIAVRAHALPLGSDGLPKLREPRRTLERPWHETWPRTALIFDTETRTDLSQRLMVGFYVVLTDDETVEVGMILPDDMVELNTREKAVLAAWHAEHPELIIHTRQTFLEDVFYPLADVGQTAVAAFNLPFDLSRLAIRATPTKRNDGFTFTFLNHIDARGRNTSPRWAPRVRMTPIDSRRAITQFTGRKHQGHFLDLATLSYALTGSKQSLESACEAFGMEQGKGERPKLGRITRELLDYGCRDALVTAELYRRALEEYARHPISLPPDKAYSPASIGKAYLREMGLRLPTLTSDVDVDSLTIQGLATETYFGGRTECRIRKTLVPVAYCDFRSMYPTVNTLMNLWSLLTAERIHAVDATEEVQAFLDGLAPGELFDQNTWAALGAIAEVEPDDDVLPKRTRFGDESYSNHSIAIGPLTSTYPLWYALPDLVASMLRTGRAPRVKRALRFVPEGRQRLRNVPLRGQVRTDLVGEALFKLGVIERQRVKRGEGAYAELTGQERAALEHFLKIFLNATSYGIFMEMNRKTRPKTSVRVYGQRTFDSKINHPEELGDFCYPAIATLITSGARLMLALAEYAVRELGGHYAFMDTDSLAIVATEDGGPVPCIGGPEQLPDGREAILALSWQQVEMVRDRFRSLNPYGDEGSVLELEKENFARCTEASHEKGCRCQGRTQLYAYAVASKRYALVNLNGDEIDVRKASEHVLGGYDKPVDPTTNEEDANWIEATWRYLVGRVLGRENELPAWAGTPVTSRLSISTPRMLGWFQRWNTTASGKPRGYGESAKPGNFLSHVLVEPLSAAALRERDGSVSLVAPFGERTSFVNRHDPTGTVYRAGVDFTPRSYRDVIDTYDRHPERKFAARDGRQCRPETVGLLQDLPVVVTRVVRIGKEANEIEEIEVGILEREGEWMTVYDDGVYEALIHVLREIPTKDIQDAIGYSRSMVKYLKAHARQPSDVVLPALWNLAGRFARERLEELGYESPGSDEDAIGLRSALLREAGELPSMNY